jgi:CHAT domain-containing protein
VNLVTAGDELMGLLRGFFAAGVRALLVSLWRVDDQTTSAFMGRFYDDFNRTSDESEDLSSTLRLAQTELMREHPHPAYWASFSLVGQP